VTKGTLIIFTRKSQKVTHPKHPQRIHQLPVTPRNLPRNLLPLEVPLEERPVGLALEEEMDLFEGAVRVGGQFRRVPGSREERGHKKSQRSPNTQSDEGEEEKMKRNQSLGRGKKRNETKLNLPIHHTHDQPLYVVRRKKKHEHRRWSLVMTQTIQKIYASWLGDFFFFFASRSEALGADQWHRY
jgi:hypothetical protein